MKDIARLRRFIQSFTRLVAQAGGDERRIFNGGQSLLYDLITHDDWLPDEFSRSNAARYQQNLLFCDPMEHFSVLSVVLGPGQATPIHDHTVWGMAGVMRGIEICEEFDQEPGSGIVRLQGTHQLQPGSIDKVSPGIGDIHRVSNGLAGRASISVHVYGANIGLLERHVYEQGRNASKSFISAYSNHLMPNIWQ